MSYPPNYHRQNDEAALFEAIEAIMQGTLVVSGGDGLDFSYVPFMLDRERRCLIGHIAAVNPQGDAMDGKIVDVVFHGPHAYISPQLYENTAVPTWNYVNVEVHGRARTIRETDQKRELLRRLTHFMEGTNAETWLRQNHDRMEKLLNGIVGVEIAIEKIRGRFKVSKNYDVAHQRKSFAALREETPPSLRAWLESLAPAE